MSMTALDIVKAVQKELRLPQSADFTSAHALLILSYVNRVQRDTMATFCNWLELKRYKQFPTIVGATIYLLPADTDELASIEYMAVDTTEIVKSTQPEIFRAVKKTTPAQPRFYRIRTLDRNMGNITVELNVPPDAIYTVDYESYIKPPLLVLETDIPLLDPATIIIGSILTAKQKQGQDVSFDLEVWKNNFSNTAADNSLGGDAEFL